MKYLHVLTLSVLAATALTSCGPPTNPAPKEADYDKLKYSNETYIDPDTGKAFTGIAHQKYKDGKTSSEWPFKDGRIHGVVIEWYPNGKPKAATEFENGERHGKNTEWTEAGLLYRERVYGEGEKILSEKNYEAGK